MKQFIIVLLAITLFACCKKDNNSLDAELAKLPPITQTGANTFGCLVNGKAYIPSGSDGQFPNFDMLIDLGDSSITLITYSYAFVGGVKAGIVIGGSPIKNVGTYLMKPFNNKVYCSLLHINNCYSPTFDSVYWKGNLNITRYDISNKIFSGEFECNVYSPDCKDTVRITHGRFDKKM